jgi:hypothetical protein
LHTGGYSHVVGECASLALGQEFKYHAAGALPRVIRGVIVTNGVRGAANGEQAAGAALGGRDPDQLVDGQGQRIEIDQLSPRSVPDPSGTPPTCG